MLCRVRLHFVLCLLVLSQSGCTLSADIKDLVSSTKETEVVDDESGVIPSVQFSLVSQKVLENQNQIQVLVVASSAYAKDIVFDIVASGSAVEGVQYDAFQTRITFPANTTSKTLQIDLNDNLVEEEVDKTLGLQIQNIQNATLGAIDQHTVTIQDDELVVKPFFETQGINWNDYVSLQNAPIVVDRDTYQFVPRVSRYFKGKPSDFIGSSQNTCAGNNCIHGGEIKKIEVRYFDSCDGLSMRDSEDAFEWRCFDEDSTLYFYSIGLKKDKGLKNFILSSGSAWKSMKVELLKNSNVVSQSIEKPWWTNSIFAYNTTNINSTGTRINLNTAGTVYAITETVTSKGINIAADKVSLVVLNGELQPAEPTTSADCDQNQGGAQDCFIWLHSSNKYLWLEGKIKAHSTLFTVRAGSSGARLMNSVFHSIDLSHSSAGNGLYLYASYSYFSDLSFDKISNAIFIGGPSFYNALVDIKVNQCAVDAITMSTTGQSSILMNVDVQNSASNSILVKGNYSNFANIKVSNSHSGVKLYAGSDNVLTNVLVHSSSNYGISGVSAGTTEYRHLTLANNTGSNLEIIDDNFRELSNVILINNNSGILLRDTTSTTKKITDIHIVGTQGNNIEFGPNATTYEWFGLLNLGSATNQCVYGTGTSSLGLMGATCIQTDNSNFTHSYNVDPNQYFVGFRNDTKNTHGANGLLGLAFASILNWFDFENKWSAWTKYNSNSMPNSNLLSRCTSGNCGIFDYSLKSNSLGKNLYGVFAEGQNCPLPTPGAQSSPFTEYLLDGVGNDNSVCESNEICYFSPDAGANMDDLWSYTKTCVSSISGATVYGK